MAEAAKGSKVGAACVSLLDAAMGAAEDSELDGKPAKKKGDSLLGKIGDLRGLIPARKDKAKA